jgi:hypothetical protein
MREEMKRTKLPSVEPPAFIFVDMKPEEPEQKPPEAIEVDAASDDISVLEEPKGIQVDAASDDVSVLEEAKGVRVEAASDDIWKTYHQS